MGIMIGSVRIPNLSLEKTTEQWKLTGTYELVSTTDTVLAKQGFNSYGGVQIPMSPTTSKLMNDFITAFQADLALTLGLT